ncbi:MAG: carbamate kinase [Clostridiales bacterium]|nr:carbamate kinase [Clostridiales bacterium]
MEKTIVLALGGNAILQPGQKGTYTEQLENVQKTCTSIAELLDNGYQIVITHGNGPQVGNIATQQIAARDKVPPMPLDICGSQTQGFMGYMIQQSLGNILRERGVNRPVVSLVTQVCVSEDDPAFKRPTKPVGGFVSKEEAEKIMAETGEKWVEDSGRGWRKVVYSPKPLEIVEMPVIKTLIKSGAIVISSGGGGIPVIKKDGKLQGVEAVIDKDRAASLMARQLAADMLVILTDVPRVAINYGKPDQRFLDRLTISEAEKFLKEGHFGEGSMLPKVEAAISFAGTGKEAVIASLDQVKEAIEGSAGTRFQPSKTYSSVS